MKIFKRITSLIFLTAALIMASPVFAAVTDEVIEPKIARNSFLQAAFGSVTGRSFDAYLSGIFNYHSIVSALNVTSWISNIVFVIFLLMLIASVSKMLSYAKTELKWFKKFSLIGLAIKKSPTDYFTKYCARNADGTYDCSYTEHKTYHKASRISLNGSIYLLAFKLAVISLLFLIEGGYLRAFAGRDSANYSIFVDTYSSGGGYSNSAAGYVLNDSFGDATSNPIATSSGGFFEKSGFIAAEREAIIAFTIPPETALNFGSLILGETAYATHTMSVTYSGGIGYDVYLRSDPLTRIGGTEQITAIGHTPSAPVTHTNQYGLNFTSNTIPALIGAAPAGGSGQVSTNYGITNSYAYLRDDAVLFADTSSAETVFTASLIMNFSSTMPAGSYATTLLYELVPRF